MPDLQILGPEYKRGEMRHYKNINFLGISYNRKKPKLCRNKAFKIEGRRSPDYSRPVTQMPTSHNSPKSGYAYKSW